MLLPMGEPRLCGSGHGCPERCHRVQWCATKTTPGPRALATRARLIDSYDMNLIGFRVLASVRRRGPDLDRQTIVRKQLKGAYHKRGYHVPIRHSFNRRHFRHGTC